MLKTLRIQNIILMEEAEIDFEPGFTVLSGETGAGKSAILKALSLVLGERADAKLIRKGAAKARVEAAFEIDSVSPILEAAGIDHSPDEPLLIRRELSADGKSRAYVNNTMTQISLLKRLSGNLLDLVGQHANLRLASPDYQRDVVDLYGGLQEERRAFARTYATVQEQEGQLASLEGSEAERLRDLARYQAEIEELEGAAVDEGEEERLFADYTRLSHAEEIHSNLSAVLEAVQSNPCKEAQSLLNKATELDPTLKSSSEQLHGICLELDELGYTLQTYQGNLEGDPSQLSALNERLTRINSLKRKYGPKLSDYLEQARTRAGELESADTRIEKLKAQVAELSAQCDEQAGELTAARGRAAKKLQTALIEHLRPLNMKGAQFEVGLTPAPRTLAGDETVDFLFAPNVGEGALPVRECASGGELSRVLLALKTALAGLELTPTLVFDEIDANIGGATGALVGQKLRAIAAERQVVCITHLPQVAQEADHHFQISKREEGGRTLSTVTPLSPRQRKEEIERMLGGVLLHE